MRLGPKRPPIAAGVRADGSGILRVARTPGIAAAVAALAPGLSVEEVDVVGPPTSARLRAAGWAEAAVLLAALAPRAGTARSASATVRSPAGATATARAEVDEDRAAHRGSRWRCGCGDPLDEVVLRSYAVGRRPHGDGLGVSARASPSTTRAGPRT